MEQILKYARVRDVKAPQIGTLRSAGIDFFIPNDFSETTLEPNCDILIPSGIKVCIPSGYMLMGAEKSGVVTSQQACTQCGREPKKDSFSTNLILGAKIVDEDYQGEIHIHLINVGKEGACLKPGMKIAQFILVPVSYAPLQESSADKLYESESQRGDGGFGSTDVDHEVFQKISLGKTSIGNINDPTRKY